MKRTKVIIASIMMAAMSQSAHAVGVEAIGLLNQYSIITAGDLTSTSWSANGALVGGNVTGGQYSIKNPNTTALTVAGNAAGNIAAQGNGVTVAGNVSGTFNLHNSGDANIGSVTGTLQNNANGKGSTYIVGDISGRVTTNGGNTTYGGELIGQGKAR